MRAKPKPIVTKNKPVKAAPTKAKLVKDKPKPEPIPAPAEPEKAPEPPRLSPAAALASRYARMTDAQVMEVMHGDPSAMLRDIRALTTKPVVSKT